MGTYEVYTGYVWDMYGTSGGVLVDGWWLLVVGFQWAVAVGSGLDIVYCKINTHCQTELVEVTVFVYCELEIVGSRS